MVWSSVFRVLAVVALLAVAPSAAYAIPITLTGESTGSLATASGQLTFNDATDTLTLTLTNTSPFDARITGVGFDVFAGNVNGFSGSTTPPSAFIFSDLDLGNVPQFNAAILDFGFITGTNFSGGSPNEGLAPGGTLTFTVTGPFGTGLTEQALDDDLFVRFQRVGANGEGSDVGTVTTVPVADGGTTLSLLGLGMLALGYIRRRKH